jgi:hypothetical protein
LSNIGANSKHFYFVDVERFELETLWYLFDYSTRTSIISEEFPEIPSDSILLIKDAT